MLISLFQPHLLNSSSSEISVMTEFRQSRKFPVFISVQWKFTGSDGHYSNQVTSLKSEALFAHNFQ